MMCNRSARSLALVVFLHHFFAICQVGDASRPDISEEGVIGEDVDRIRTVKVGVIVENYSGRRVKDFILLHKHTGLATGKKLHALVFNDIAPHTTTSAQEVVTKVGLGSLRQDYWLASWRVAPVVTESSPTGCPVCAQLDGSCESWISAPDNFLYQSLMDPKVWITALTNAAAAAAIAPLAVASGGFAGWLLLQAKIIGIQFLNINANNAFERILGDVDTDGYKHCDIKEKDFQNWETYQIPLKVVIPPDPENYNANAETHGNGTVTSSLRAPIRIERYKRGDPSKVRSKCEIDATSLPCRAPDVLCMEPCQYMSLRLSSNNNSVQEASVIHRNNNLQPNLETIEFDKEDLELQYPKTTRTTLGSWHGVSTQTEYDWWQVAWRTRCLMKKSGQKKFGYRKQQTMNTDAKTLGWRAAWMTGNAVVSGLAAPIKVMQKMSQHTHSSGAAVLTSDRFGDRSINLFGREHLMELARSDKTDSQGLFRCNILEQDMAGPVEFNIDSDSVELVRPFRQQGSQVQASLAGCKVPANEEETRCVERDLLSECVDYCRDHPTEADCIQARAKGCIE
eukprot:TRINITY_DN15361_c0_g1_i1.p1 TRINITY_DN15361_c0_g1~~TRINITY_DN15361_c0_g1_i1.p1  ORF type:complete len:567 (-),score=70.25 TRINITY_DN15361_c0_g1_i1:25-1725(-)